MAGMNYFLSKYIRGKPTLVNGDALVVAIPSISYGILKMIKLGIKKWKGKLWLKLWLKIPKRILLTRFNINFITNKQL
jgi:hypothetical protein